MLGRGWMVDAWTMTYVLPRCHNFSSLYQRVASPWKSLDLRSSPAWRTPKRWTSTATDASIFWTLHLGSAAVQQIHLQMSQKKMVKRGCWDMLVCWLLWFLCCCSMFLPYLWCFMWWGFWVIFPPSFHSDCLFQWGGQLLKLLGFYVLVCWSSVWKDGNISFM